MLKIPPKISIALDGGSQQTFCKDLKSSIPLLKEALIVQYPASPQEFSSSDNHVMVITVAGGSDKKLLRLLNDWKHAEKRPVLLLVGPSFEPLNATVKHWVKESGIGSLRDAIHVSDGYTKKDVQNKLGQCIDTAERLSIPLATSLDNASAIVADPEILSGSAVILPLKR